jgi:transposase
MKKISNEAIQQIILLLMSGLDGRKVAEKIGVSHASVYRIRMKHVPELETSVGGRPEKLTARARRTLTRIVTSGRADTAAKAAQTLQNELALGIGASTCRRTLRKEGLRAKIKRRKPMLRKRHIKARLLFAQKYSSWTVDDWHQVIFSDETKINRLGSGGRKWIWSGRNENLTKRTVDETLKFGGGSIMMWGCMTYRGTGCGCRIEGNMDAALYTEILESGLLETINEYSFEKENIVFQHDNDPKHTSRMATEWLKINKIDTLDWPAQSPDLNPIEHLWQELKIKLNGYAEQPNSIYELWRRVEIEWERIPAEKCAQLIDSMPEEITVVLKAKGGYTKY